MLLPAAVRGRWRREDSEWRRGERERGKPWCAPEQRGVSREAEGERREDREINSSRQEEEAAAEPGCTGREGGSTSELDGSLINSADCAKTRAHWGNYSPATFLPLRFHIKARPFWITRQKPPGVFICDGGSGWGWELRQRIRGQLYWSRRRCFGSRWLSFAAHPSRGRGLQLGYRTDDDGGTGGRTPRAPGVRREAVPEPDGSQPSEGDFEAEATVLQDGLSPGNPSRWHRAGDEKGPQQIRWATIYSFLL